MARQYYIYMLMNRSDTTSYIGVTNNLIRRVWEHKEKMIEGFTSKYNLIKLVYYEAYATPLDAIIREKQLKKWSKSKKLNLIKQLNPGLRDLYAELWGFSPPESYRSGTGGHFIRGLTSVEMTEGLNTSEVGEYRSFKENLID